MVADAEGYRLNVGIILTNDEKRLFWGKRVGQQSWQFPQGGVCEQETLHQALYRELHEEVGLSPEDVELLGETKAWLKYRLPERFIRYRTKPLVIGQKQKWFLLRLVSSEHQIRLDTGDLPEFDDWCWIDDSVPVEQVIYFKRQVYKQALAELRPILLASD